MNDITTIEVLENAQINLKTCERLFPGLRKQPPWLVAISQLENAIARIEEEDSRE